MTVAPQVRSRDAGADELVPTVPALRVRERSSVPALLLDLPALVPGLIAVGLFLVWAVHGGGTDVETWTWGGLAFLSLLGGAAVALGGQLRLTRAGALAAACFLAYAVWSFLSVTWARDKGSALFGSELAVIYLVIYALMNGLPWTARGAIATLVVYTVGVGSIAVVLLVRMAARAHVSGLFLQGRLSAPTGYFNATGALFGTVALLGIGLAARRELPGLLRGALLAFAAAGLDLAIVVQSRGWLFTLPFLVLAAVLVSRDRLRLAAAACLPIAGAALDAHRLVHVYADGPGTSLTHPAMVAARPALLICCAVFALGTLAAWAGELRPVSLGTTARRTIGTALVAATLAGGLGIGLAISHGHLTSYVSRQWHGFSHEPSSPSTGSHFAVVGSGRYDFWRVALDAFRHHPISGLGQSNFINYYDLHRHTDEATQAVHSLELRLLGLTGIVGFLLYMAGLAAALVAALSVRRRGTPGASALAGVAMLPFLAWFIHGSIDWFWEIPALSGPALGFLGMAGGLARSGAPGAPGAPGIPGVPGGPAATRRVARPRRHGRPAAVGFAAGLRRRGRPAAVGFAAAELAAILVLASSYASAHEQSIAAGVANESPARAISLERRAHRLNPLDSVPDFEGGWDALSIGRDRLALENFQRGLRADDGTWVGWLGAGLSASALGERAAARADFVRAHHINRLDTAARQALVRVDTAHPLDYPEAVELLGDPD